MSESKKPTTLYARQSIMHLGVPYQPGDELPGPRADIENGIGSRGERFITDEHGRHWKVGSGTGAPSAEPVLDPHAADRVLDPEHDRGLVARGLATTDAAEAATLWEIRQIEQQRNAETADVVDARIAELRAQLP